MTFHTALLLLFIFWLHNVALHDLRGPDNHSDNLEGKCKEFYFKHKDFYFQNCIRSRSKHRWCSQNSTYQNFWKYCFERDAVPCVFPFWYRRLIYRSCTEDGDAFGRKWCSLTKNYNKDRMWKYCS